MSSLKKKLEAMDEDLKDKERSSRELRTQLEDANAIKVSLYCNMPPRAVFDKFWR